MDTLISIAHAALYILTIFVVLKSAYYIVTSKDIKDPSAVTSTWWVASITLTITAIINGWVVI